ncbi:MAG TPA: glycosyltransferase [Azospirillaceae bacterium]|nr:glycosyltransferase [Azospirillaceae bacterium]
MRIALFKGDFRYDAVNHFTDALAEAFSASGVKPMIVDMRSPREEIGAQLSAVCDADDLIALFGFNALGSSIKVDGRTLHDALSTPFVSYLLEHPLFHADALTRLQDQPILCVDGGHVRFMESFSAPQAHLALHAGATPPEYYAAPPWAERPNRVVFAGSFEPLSALRTRLAAVIAHDRSAADAGIPPLNDAFEALADELESINDEDLADVAAMHPLTFAVQQFLGISAHYATLLQCLILWRRAKLRHALLTQLDRDGLAVDLYGAGWNAAGFQNHRALGPLPFAELSKLLPTYRFTLNISPLLGDGLHDRVVYGALSGTVVCTDENPQSKSLIAPGGALGYAPGDVGGLADAINRLDKTAEGAAMAAMGREIAMFDHTWAARARKILNILGR